MCVYTKWSCSHPPAMWVRRRQGGEIWPFLTPARLACAEKARFMSPLLFLPAFTLFPPCLGLPILICTWLGRMPLLHGSMPGNDFGGGVGPLWPHSPPARQSSKRLAPPPPPTHMHTLPARGARWSSMAVWERIVHNPLPHRGSGLGEGTAAGWRLFQPPDVAVTT